MKPKKASSKPSNPKSAPTSIGPFPGWTEKSADDHGAKILAALKAGAQEGGREVGEPIMSKSAKAVKAMKEKSKAQPKLDYPSDPVSQELKRLGLPLTRENWLGMNYPFDPIPNPYPAELEMEMPEQLRLPEYRED